MDAVGPIVLVASAYLLLWVVTSYLIRRVRDEDRGDDRFETTVHRVSDSSAYRPDQATRERTSATVVCPSCGVENDRDYTFCRQCVTDLSGGPRRPTGRTH